MPKAASKTDLADPLKQPVSEWKDIRCFVQGEAIDIEEGFARMVNAMVDRAVHDYSHRRSTFLADSSLAINTARIFIFREDACALSGLVKVYSLPIDLGALRKRAVAIFDAVEQTRRLQRLREQRVWWIQTGKVWREVRQVGRF